jgi:RhtB (resistance to homoserine/threonine) family protein
MIGIIHYETFVITGILLNLTPGNDTVFILSRSIAQGKNAGIMSALGIGTGSLIHTTFAAFGLSIIIAQSLSLFSIIKYAGAAYLIYIGIKMFLERSQLNFNPAEIATKTNFKTIYRDAVFTNVLNPKVAMFFIAFLPQFIDPNYKHSVLPFLILGISFTTTGTIWCLILAGYSSKLFSGLRNNQKISSYLNKICGIALIGLGIKVALTDRKV